MQNKRGQVTVFVIIGIIIVVGAIFYFTLRPGVGEQSVPASIEPIKTSFLNCLEEEMVVGISIMETKGGFLEEPAFVPGSRYQPFSSKLTFAGVEVPYWFYMKGSNLPATQIPTLDSMEGQLERYIETAVKNCNFKSFRDEGYSIGLGKPSAIVSIDDDFVDVEMDYDISVEKDLDASILSSHSMRIKSSLGFLYNSAVEVYEKEQADFFLENRTVDVLRLYAPVDGFKLSCAPLIWNANQVNNDFRDALEMNTMALNNRGEKNDYFDLEISRDFDARFIYASGWPTYFEVNPTEGAIMKAKAVGNQDGLGALGFCYVPYHFVYNIRHPVMVQLSKDEETFQFPMVVLVEGNVPRESRATETITGGESNICEYMNSEVKIDVYDSDLEPVEAQLSFSCFDATCDLGSTKNGAYDGPVPQCGNGILKVTADGYKTSKNIYSSVSEGSLFVIMDKKYEKEVSLIVDGGAYNGDAIVSFTSDDESVTLIYPENKKVSLVAGVYDIQIYLSANSSIQLPASTQEQCYDAPRAGVLGLAGFTKKECVEVEVPEQMITSALIGGGNVEYEFNNNELENYEELEISGMTKRSPESLEALQMNYILVENNELEVVMK
ncbi:MAG: hypothetical protein PF542_06215 [Nanoarchaeota archaeon]|jgi:hypothetical protein|nr:hypothetical protein [Nanoarchaeota archaeon]